MTEKIYTASDSQPRLVCSGFRHIFKRVCKNCWKLLLNSCLFVCLSIRPSARLSVWNNSAPAGRIFMKFEVRGFFLNSVEKIQMPLQKGKGKALP